MSVQAGVWNFDGKPVDRAVLTKMSGMTAEYAPDGESIHLDANVGLLYRPFHTTPESRSEQQPYKFGKQLLMTWDGRLDNRDELVSELKGEFPLDGTDVSVVAAVLEKWGVSGLSRIVGDWALAKFDSGNKELILARDYIGAKQLFYFPMSNGICWCTQLRPLALSGQQLTVSDQYVAGYLALFPDANLTPFQEILSVPPGKYVRVREARITVHPHWEFSFRVKTRYKSDRDYEEHFRALFRQAVRRRMRSGGPLLMQLSGGWDSSSVVCMADDILAKEGAETPRLDTFSYYDSNEPGEDDLEHLQKVEQRRGRVGYHADLAGTGDSLPLQYREFVELPGFFVRSEIRKAVCRVEQLHEYRVVLSGLGGDEMNGQALDPRLLIAELIRCCRPFRAARDLVSWSLLLRRPWSSLLFQSLTYFLPIPVRARLSPHAKLEPWVKRRFAGQYQLSARQIAHEKGFWTTSPAVRDSSETVATLARTLTYSLPCIVEHRYPYLDQTLVEFLTTIPLDQLLRPGQRRFLMKRSLASLLPEEILARKTKASAGRCYSVAVEKHWDEIEGLMRSPVIEQLGYVDHNRVIDALHGMKHGQIPRYFLRLFKALSLEIWLQDVRARGLVSVRGNESLAATKEMACA